MQIYGSARKHGIDDSDIDHAVEHALAVGEQDDGKVLYLGPDRAGNLLEVVSVLRDDGTEIVIHVMAMTSLHDPTLRASPPPRCRQAPVRAARRLSAVSPREGGW